MGFQLIIATFYEVLNYALNCKYSLYLHRIFTPPVIQLQLVYKIEHWAISHIYRSSVSQFQSDGNRELSGQLWCFAAQAQKEILCLGSFQRVNHQAGSTVQQLPPKYANGWKGRFRKAWHYYTPKAHGKKPPTASAKGLWDATARPEGMPRVTPRTHLRPPGSQLTLMQAMSRSNTWEPGQPKAVAHNWYLAELIATGMKPFSMVDEPAFIKFMKFCVPRWLIPGKTFCPHRDSCLSSNNQGAPPRASDNFCWERGSFEDRHLDKLPGEWLYVNDWTLDRPKAWGHFIVVQSSAGHVRLWTKPYYGKHCYKLQEVCEEWLSPFGLRTGYNGTDNTQNVARALRELKMKRISCVAHCLNLVVKAWLRKAGDLVEETLRMARAICGHFRHLASAQMKLKDIQRRHNLFQHKLNQDVARHWNSKFYMAKRLNSDMPLQSVLTTQAVTILGPNSGCCSVP